MKEITDQSDKTAASVWDLYQETGCAATVARELRLEYHAVRYILNKDPIRREEIRASRSEAMARRWERRETQASELTDRMFKIINSILNHIDDCFRRGTHTELTDPSDREGKRTMSPVRAMQWLMETKQIDSMTKAGFNAMKASETMLRLGLLQDNAPGIKKLMGTDPSAMSDAELAQIVNDLESAGKQLPWGLNQWKQVQEVKARLPVVGDSITYSPVDEGPIEEGP